MKKNSLLLLIASSALAFAACGGGDGDGSGIDGAKQLTELTDAEIVNICEYSEGLINTANLRDLECYSEGIFSEEGPCQTVYDACVMQPADASDCPDAAADPLPTCASNVTVSEIENCLRAQAAQLNGYSISCDTTQAELGEIFDAPQPAACDIVNEKCPDLLGDGPA